MNAKRAAADTTVAGYQSGFGNHFSTEALPGALPLGRNSPQRPAFGLYAEQFSGTAFTAPRHANRRSWLYRIRPAAAHGSFTPLTQTRITSDFTAAVPSPNQLRWSAPPMPRAPTDFVAGLSTLGGNGSPDAHAGCGIYWYVANHSMQQRYFYDADGELLLVPQQGGLRLYTELGRLEVRPLQIAVIPRGLRFRVELMDGAARGYVCENFGAPFRLPDLGPIGSNGLANPRDFQTPVAWYEERTGDFELVAKFAGSLWSARIDHSPLDVVAWHGNYAPYRYDLRHFNTIGSVSFDHPDPSIFLVLQSPSDTAGVDLIDFVIFPPRWLVMQDTFRPPWFHRNVASEFMGLIEGVYDAKAQGFSPGGASLHNCMSGHGPDAASYQKARAADTSRPQHLSDTMAFMFETRSVIRPTRYALDSPLLQRDYSHIWRELPSYFSPPKPRAQRADRDTCHAAQRQAVTAVNAPDFTHDPARRSWVESANAPGSDFPLQNLPFGSFRRAGSSEVFRGGVAIGDQVLDLGALHGAGLLEGAAAVAVAAAARPSLNALMALGRDGSVPLRAALSRALGSDAPLAARLRPLLVPQAKAEFRVAADIGDFTDFYASIHHATSVGRMFRPDNPLLPNYKWIPIAYHGRASSVVVSGQSFRRPRGQLMPPGAGVPLLRATGRLDYELEVGAFVGRGNEPGVSVPLQEAEQHLFGLCLLNDWSARDVQAWEYQPLGPFLAKNFATTVSPWIVTVEALAPFRVPWQRPAEEPPPLAYLDDAAVRGGGGIDLSLEVWLQSERMRASGTPPQRLSRSNFRDSWWTVAQMLTHHTVNGCNLQAGDLLGSGTQSGPQPQEAGSLLELSQGASSPLQLLSGEVRTFLEDGDRVVLRGSCEREGFVRIGFGECAGTVLPALAT